MLRKVILYHLSFIYLLFFYWIEHVSLRRTAK